MLCFQPASKKLDFLDQLATRDRERAAAKAGAGTGTGSESPKAGGTRRSSGGALHESPRATAGQRGRETTGHAGSATGSGQHSPKVVHSGSTKEPPSAFDTLLRLEQKERERDQPRANAASKEIRGEQKERRSSLSSPKAARPESLAGAGAAAQKEPLWKDKDVVYKFREREFALEREDFKRHQKTKEKKDKLKDSLEMSSDEACAPAPSSFSSPLL